MVKCGVLFEVRTGFLNLFERALCVRGLVILLCVVVLQRYLHGLKIEKILWLSILINLLSWHVIEGGKLSCYRHAGGDKGRGGIAPTLS
jgi:hypothetical protein